MFYLYKLERKGFDHLYTHSNYIFYLCKLMGLIIKDSQLKAPKYYLLKIKR